MRPKHSFDRYGPAGAVVWLASLLASAPFSIRSVEWVHALILFAPLLLFLPGLSLMEKEGLFYRFRPLLFAGAVLLAVAFMMPSGIEAGALAAGWLLLTVFLAYRKLYRFNFHRIDIVGACYLTSYLFLPVGAAWALADRLAFRPLGFDPVIVKLTAAHFHYAGFLLPLITGLLMDRTEKFKWLGWGVILGVPLVAAGITGTHYGAPGVLESMAAVMMAVFGLGVGVLHIRHALAGKRLTLFRGCRLVGGILLSGGMVLAMSYGLRFFFPEGALSIPGMYAWHGSLNAGGLALLVLGWYQQKDG